MRWSIRNRILVPLIVIQAVSVTAASLMSAAMAAARNEQRVVERMTGVVEAIGRANFPMTPGVLARMRGLSGAHFLVLRGGRIVDSSLGQIDVVQMNTAGIARSLGTSRTRIGGEDYRLEPITRGMGEETLVVLYPETSLRQARREAAFPPIAAGLAAMTAMAVVTTWIAHRISSRVRRLERGVASIAEGDFREVLVGSERDEVRDLAQSINRMCRRLLDMRHSIESTERARLLAQLGAGLAHQLRNSLTGARLSVQLHARRHPSPGDQSLQIALRQLAITEELVRGLLTLGRAEKRELRPCDIGEILEEVAQLVGSSAAHSDVRLTRNGTGLCPAICDPTALRAAVLNLALNAIEAAGAGGRVRLATEAADADVAITVADTGPGPPPELAARLAEPFVTGKAEGVGLGLALASRVAEDHGGRLSWTRAGGETCFTITFPAGAPDEPSPDRR